MPGLREELERVAGEIGEQAQPEPTQAAEPSAPEPQETETQRADRTRDESGKFAKNSTAQPAAKSATVLPPSSVPPAAAVEPDAPWRKPPTSWKKDYWEKFATLPPEVQQYTHERESQFASGVSTYKQEAERALPILQALAPFQEELARAGVKPEAWLSDLGNVHRILRNGSLPEKIQMLQQVAQRNGVPLQAFATGQVDPIQQYVAPLQQQIQALTGQLNGYQQQKEKDEYRVLQEEVNKYETDLENYPHFEAVRPEMIRLLETGYASDLKNAYRIAVRADDSIWETEQQRLLDAKAKQADQSRQQRVNNARQNTVSPRSDTPAGNMTDGTKGLRSNLEKAAEAVLGGGRL